MRRVCLGLQRVVHLIVAGGVLLAPAVAQNKVPPKGPAVYAGGPVTQKVTPPGLAYNLQQPRELALPVPAGAELAPLAASSWPMMVGIHRTLAPESITTGTWQTLADGRQIWRMSVRSPGAIGVRVQFTNFSIGAGQVWIYGGGETDGPYTGDGVFGDQQFWSAMIPDEAATIEYQPDASQAAGGTLPFQVSMLAHQVTAPGGPESATATAQAQVSSPYRLPAAEYGLTPLANPVTPPPDPAAVCNLDVNCYPEWAGSAKSVAHIIFETEEGQAACSGSLLATRNNSFKLYFLTADHCINTEAVARTVQIFWAYQTSGCGAPRPTTKGTLKSAVGANLLVHSGPGGGDFSLLLLRDVPAGVTFNGWDTGEPDLAARFVAIHHPKASYKRISFGIRDVDASFIIDGAVFPKDAFFEALFQNGVVEPGSSGSPIFTSPGVIAGELSYALVVIGGSICDLKNQPAGYGRFSRIYQTAHDYLEDLPAADITVAPATLQFSGANGTISNPQNQPITVTTQSANSVRFNVSADSPWVNVPAAGTVSASATATLPVSIDPSYFKSTKTYTTTVAVNTAAGVPKFVTVKVDYRVDRSQVTLSASPIPVIAQDPDADGARWFFTIRLDEKGGVNTKITSLKINGADYSSQIAGFFGTDTLPANGSLQASLRASNLVVPTTQYFEVAGTDEGSGQTWYQALEVPFQ